MIEPRNKNTNGTTATKKKIRTPLLDRSNNKNVVNDEKPKKMSRFQELFMKSAKNTTVVYEDGLQKTNQQKQNFQKSKDDIQDSINNRIVNYNHLADKTVENKYNAQYKLQLADDKILPEYIVNNKDKYKNWFDFHK